MLILETPKRTPVSDENMIPLINVVFLLLIFFMVAGQIQHSDPQKIDPPDSISEQILQKQNIAKLLVTETSILYLDGKFIAAQDLSEQLRLMVTQAGDSKSFTVQVKVDAQLDVAQLQTTLRSIKAAGLLRISLITQKMKDQ
ncbi:biopolymer transporter ExbD [Psychromonas sp. MB-3u-54]|uniref:ExbD/TolR family protein n=1 Tax=Psychromonas sp. MB-3u-54 TaxID=2058319 RepID=UPI000C32C733|nr:biopolymer transporter ExbD [Psychromonas sp. MB-3u-54]PKH04277.1 biopolymer transporter ExbD [Psychromonas sp. MB-3u-54]